MITFLLIENKNTKELYDSIANNYDIAKYGYDIIITNTENIDIDIENAKNDYVFVVNSICYFNTVMIEHLFECVERNNTDIFLCRFIDKSSNLRLPIKNIYNSSSEIIEGKEVEDILNIVDMNTISFVVKKSIIKDSIKYSSTFCKDVLSKVNTISYVKDIDFLFVNYDYTKIIVDGFGVSELKDNLILDAFKDNKITHTSVVTNGNSFKRAVDLIHNTGIINVGLHFNISNGYSEYNPAVIFNSNSIDNLSDEFIESELQAQLNVLNKNNIFISYISTDYNDRLNHIICKYGIEYRKEASYYKCKNNEECDEEIHSKYRNIIVDIG